MSRIINATVGQRIRGGFRMVASKTSLPLASATNDDRVRQSSELPYMRLRARLAIYAKQAAQGLPIGLR